MRLWHKDLIPVLPRQQLLGQWRECYAIMANIAKNGTPNHLLVNKVMDYPISHFYAYARLVDDEKENRGYKCSFEKFCDVFHRTYPDFIFFDSRVVKSLFEGWHDDRYLTQCYYNLQEKYDCGGITENEWQKIDARYKELIGGNEWQ